MQRSYHAGQTGYSRTSQDGHPSGNAKLAVLWRWPSYGGLLFVLIFLKNKHGKARFLEKISMISLDLS